MDEGEIALNLTALESMDESLDDLREEHDEIEALIEAGDYARVEELLAEMGGEVEITPKIGCSPIHYSKLNLVNWQNENKDTPLIRAARVDCKMVQIMIKYGGNPNHANKEGDTPLSIAANRSDRDTIDALLFAGGDLRAAVLRLTSPLRYESEEQWKERSSNGFSVRPLKFLLAGDVYLKCRDPIKMAFDICKDITSIKNEMSIEFESFIKDADSFAYKFMNHCDNMSEAREILTSSDKLLSNAIEQCKKKFVSHPYSLQIIDERWYGETLNTFFFGKTIMILKCMISPIVLPLLFLKFFFCEKCRVPFMESSFSDLMRLMFVPCVCFITDAINYVVFAVVMVFACLTPFEAVSGSYNVTYVEYMLYYSVFARILIEADHLIQKGWITYFCSFWNMVDATVLGSIAIAAIYKGYIKYVVDKQKGIYSIPDPPKDSSDNNKMWCLNQTQILIDQLQHGDSMNVNYIYAVAEFILIIRLLGLLEYHQSLGTMLIALKYLVADVMKFSVILITVMLGTSVALYSMAIALTEWNEELSSIKVDESCLDFKEKLAENIVIIPVAFASFSDTWRNVLWTTFGLFNVVVRFNNSY